jgi:hypothetical protein
MFNPASRSLSRALRLDGARAALIPAAIAVLAAAEPASAQDRAKATWPVGPFVSAAVSESSYNIEAGVESYPSPVSAIGARFAAIFRKTDPEVARAEVSTERPSLGLKAQLLTEFGRGSRPEHGTLSAPDLSLFGAAIEGQWTFAKYDFRPAAGPARSVIEHSWAIGLRGWWFTTLRPPQALEGCAEGQIEKGTRPPPRPTRYSAWLTQPQLQVAYGRNAVDAEDSYVVVGRNPEGLQLVERMKLTPPAVRSVAAIQFAMPISPPSSRLAFAPALRLGASGADGQWEPFSRAARARVDLRLYYFAFDQGQGPALRIGMGPYLDARLYGNDRRDEIVGGAVLELRASTSRLEY